MPPADDELLVPPGDDASDDAGDEELCDAGPVLWEPTPADGDVPAGPGVRGCVFTMAAAADVSGGVLLGCWVLLVVRSCGLPMPLAVTIVPGLATSYLQLPAPAAPTKLVTLGLLLLLALLLLLLLLAPKIGDIAPGEVSD